MCVGFGLEGVSNGVLPAPSSVSASVISRMDSLHAPRRCCFVFIINTLLFCLPYKFAVFCQHQAGFVGVILFMEPVI